MTIYGSDYEPRYSVGCQVGITIDNLKDRVRDNANTVSSSADTYAPFLGTFEEIGIILQREYDREIGLVEEIKAMRREYWPDVDC